VLLPHADDAKDRTCFPKQTPKKIILDAAAIFVHVMFMTENRTQPLSERFASIFSMMLGMLRAQGLRSLLHLPQLWLAAREFRRLSEALVALLKAFEAGTLPRLAPAPTIAPQEPQSPAPPRPAVRSAPRARQRPAARPAPPPANPTPRCPRADSGAYPAPTMSRPCRRARNPFAVPRPSAGIIATGRST
jgi:hypothetical protein